MFSEPARNNDTLFIYQQMLLENYDYTPYTSTYILFNVGTHDYRGPIDQA